MADQFKYWAFISYSHTDAKWGDWLHRTLETYKVPKRLLKQSADRDALLPARIFPVFRDREELPTSSDLGTVISDALVQSRCLIVICSPRAASSRWVSQEILEFKRLGRENRLLALIVDGEPNAADTGDGSNAAAECFPEPLQHPLGQNGLIDHTQRIEPIAADVRPGKDGKTNAALKLIAGILGVNYDDLKRRDETRRRRRRLFGSLVIACIVLAIAGIWLWKEQDRRHESAMSYVIKARGESRSSALTYYAKANSISESHVARANAVAYLEDEKLPEQVFAHESSVIATAISPDAKTVLTGGDDNTARLWNTKTGKAIGDLMRCGGPVSRVAFSLDGKRILTETAAETVRVWNPVNGQPIGNGVITAAPSEEDWRARGDFPDTTLVDACTFYGTNGAAVVKADYVDNTIVIRAFDTLRGNVIANVRISPTNGVLDFKFSADGSRILTTSTNGTVYLWDVLTGRPVAQPLVHDRSSGAGTHAMFSPDGKLVLTLHAQTGRTTLKFWDAASGQPFGKMIQVQASSALFESGGKSLVTFTPGKQDQALLQRWDIASGNAVGAPQHAVWSRLSTLGPDTETVLTLRSSGGRAPVQTAQIWKMETVTLSTNQIKVADKPAAMAFSPDGRLAIASGASNTVNVWDIGRKVFIGRLVGLVAEANALVFSPDRSIIATAAGETAQLWNSTNGHPIGKVMRHKQEIRCVAFSPDGKTLLTGGLDDVVLLWDVRTQAPIGSPLQHTSGVFCACFSPDGKIIATGSWDYLVRFWDAQSGKLIGGALEDESQVQSIAFAPNGSVVVTGSGCSNGGRIRQGTAHFWDARSHRSIRKIPVSEFELLTVGFTKDGNTVITGGGDRSLDFWDASSGEFLVKSFETSGHVIAIGFTANQRQIWTGSDDGVVESFDLSWLTTRHSPSELLLRAQLVTHQEVTESGAIRDIQFTEWLALFRQYKSHNHRN